MHNSKDCSNVIDLCAERLKRAAAGYGASSGPLQKDKGVNADFAAFSSPKASEDIDAYVRRIKESIKRINELFIELRHAQFQDSDSRQ